MVLFSVFDCSGIFFKLAVDEHKLYEVILVSNARELFGPSVQKSFLFARMFWCARL